MKTDEKLQHGEIFQKNKTIWDEIYSSKGAGSYLNYPCEDLVVVAKRCLSSAKISSGKLLDIGFGSGNNLEFLAGLGFESSGVEVSPAAIKITGERLSKLGLKAQLSHLAEGYSYPFADHAFDVVVAWHVLSYNDESSLRKTIQEIRRVLKPNGLLLATFPTLKDYRFVNSKRVKGNTFEFIKDKSNQNGIIITAVGTEDEVRKIFSPFQNIQLGYSEISIHRITNSHWLIVSQPTS